MKGNHDSFWLGRRCLVTGGLGFCGSRLCEYLLARGARVHVLDRVRPQNSYLVLTRMMSKVEFIQGDVRDIELLRTAFERFEIDTVFHLAAQPIAPLSNDIPFETLSINALGTYSLLEAMRASALDKTMVFASSGAYYGTTTNEQPILEDQAPMSASNIYAPSKVAGDIAVRCYQRVFGMKAAVCRFMNTYGPGDTNFSRIVPRAIAKLISGASYDFGDRDDGTTILDYLHVHDMSRAYVAVAESMERISGEAFNFGGGNPISVRELVRLISRLFDGQEREPVFRGPGRDSPMRKCLDTSKAQRLLGWQPSISLEDGLTETIEWYQHFWPKLQAVERDGA